MSETVRRFRKEAWLEQLLTCSGLQMLSDQWASYCLAMGLSGWVELVAGRNGGRPHRYPYQTGLKRELETGQFSPKARNTQDIYSGSDTVSVKKYLTPLEVFTFDLFIFTY